jgi:carbonic anhydrase
VPHTWDPTSLAPEDALERLLAGNLRFLEQRTAAGARLFRPELAEQQQRPFAIVLGCSDSRLPVEILFDQGFGDLFVVRVAGNVVAPSIVGSIEFAASQFGTRLVVVLGHTQCGAIRATVEALATGDSPQSKSIRAITDYISPHLTGLVREGPDPTDPWLLRRAMQANVRSSAEHIRHGSRILEDLVLKGRLKVVGAEFELETGRVSFLE